MLHISILSLALLSLSSTYTIHLRSVTHATLYLLISQNEHSNPEVFVSIMRKTLNPSSARHVYYNIICTYIGLYRSVFDTLEVKGQKIAMALHEGGLHVSQHYRSITSETAHFLLKQQENALKNSPDNGNTAYQSSNHFLICHIVSFP